MNGPSTAAKRTRIVEGIFIETDRLVLRLLEDRDAPAIASIRNTLDAARMAGDVPHPYPVEAAQGWIAMARAKRMTLRSFSFAMEDPREGVVGDIGVFIRGRDPAWELGYAVDPRHRRRGYAREAVLGALAWARDVLKAQTVTAGVFADNAASKRLLESCGFTLNGASTRVYSLARNAQVRCDTLVRDLTAS